MNLIFPFGTDCKFTLIPKLGEDVLKETDMVDLTVRVINRNRGIDFVPEWAWKDTGIEIEIQRENIKFAGSYQVYLDWRRPDESYSDGFQDTLNSCTIIQFSTECNIVSEDTAVIEVSPIYKGDKGEQGDNAYQVWLSEGNTGTIEDYLDWIQKPAKDAAQTAIEAAEGADTAKTNADQAAQNADQKATYATEQGNFAKEQAEIIEGYELIESEEYSETIFNDI